MTCDICDKFPVPIARFEQLAISKERHGTLFCCLECGQIIEQLEEARGHRLTSVVETMFDYDYRLPYINRINCRQCGSSFNMTEVLQAAPYSCPISDPSGMHARIAVAAIMCGSAATNGGSLRSGGRLVLTGLSSRRPRGQVWWQ